MTSDQGRQHSIAIDSDWDDEDDQELIDHCAAQPFPLLRLEAEEIARLPIGSLEVVFANTWTIQAMLPHYRVPDTYPSCFGPLYGRSIATKSKAECLAAAMPFFVKPTGNSKAFTGFVARDHIDLEVVRASSDASFYVCDVVHFVSEFRVFLGPSPRVYGWVEATSFISGQQNGATEPPPQALLDEIAQANTIGFCVVDVGLTSSGSWCVVEVNPPFALSSYAWPIDKYFGFCRDAWQALSLQQPQE